MLMESSVSQPVQTKDHNLRHIALTGDLTSFEGAEFKESLVKLFANDGLVSLDLSRVTRVDTSAIQLMVSARKQARMLVMGVSKDLQSNQEFVCRSLNEPHRPPP